MKIELEGWLEVGVVGVGEGLGDCRRHGVVAGRIGPEFGTGFSECYRE